MTIKNLTKYFTQFTRIQKSFLTIHYYQYTRLSQCTFIIIAYTAPRRDIVNPRHNPGLNVQYTNHITVRTGRPIICYGTATIVVQVKQVALPSFGG